MNTAWRRRRRNTDGRVYCAPQGGILIIEGFAGKDAPTGAAFDDNEVLRTFGNLRVLFYEDAVAVPKWGRQRVSRRVIRFIAQRD